MAVSTVFIDEEQWVSLNKVCTLDIAYRELLYVNSMSLRKPERASRVADLQARIAKLRDELGLS